MVSKPAVASGPSARLVIGGVGFIFLWLIIVGAWAVASISGMAMANDSGAVAPDRHATLFLLLVTGEVVAALAGLPGGLAFFWRSRRGFLLGAFAFLFVLGAGLQVFAIWSFARAAAKPGMIRSDCVTFAGARPGSTLTDRSREATTFAASMSFQPTL